jgi:hypothetical protein
MAPEELGLAMTIVMFVGIVGFIGLMFVVGGLGTFFLMKKLKPSRQSNDLTLQTGLAAKATVLKMATQSMRVSIRGYGGAQKLSLTVQVHSGPEIPEPYTTQFTPMVPDIAMPRIQPQAEILCKVSRTDRDKVVIDFEAMGYSGLENFAL